MKTIIQLLLTGLALLSICHDSPCRADIFFSYSDFGEGSAASNRTLDGLSIGDRRSAFIWVEDSF